MAVTVPAVGTVFDAVIKPEVRTVKKRPAMAMAIKPPVDIPFIGIVASNYYLKNRVSSLNKPCLMRVLLTYLNYTNTDKPSTNRNCNKIKHSVASQSADQTKLRLTNTEKYASK